MTMTDDLGRIDFDRLQKVVAVNRVFRDEPQSKPFVVAVKFVFDNIETLVSAVSSDDAVAVASGAEVPYPKDVEEAHHELHDLSQLPPWNRCVGERLLWGWSMTNGHGHCDAVQMQFADSPGTTIQLFTVASELTIREVSPRSNIRLV
jgi:hypothetical protein